MTPTRQTFRTAYRARRQGKTFREVRETTQATTGCGFSLAMFSAIAADQIARSLAARGLDAAQERARLAAARRQARLFKALTA